MKNTNENLLNINEILEQKSKYGETEITTLSDGFDIEFHPYFSAKKIENIIMETGEFLNSDEEEGKSFVELIHSSEEDYVLFLYFMIIKEFTHLGVQMEDKTKPSELFPYFEALIETGYLTELVDEVFLPEEIDKVFKRAITISAMGETINQIGIDFFDQIGKNKEKLERIREHTSNTEEK